MEYRFKSLMALLLTLLILSVSSAHAALISCSTSGGGSSYFSFSDASDGRCIRGNDTNTINNSYDLFGMTGWVLADKNDGPDGDSLINFLMAPENGANSGNWGIDTLAGLDDIVITLKAGNGFGAFLLDLTVRDPLMGTWSSGRDLSHASIYYNGVPASVPEPGIFALMGAGLIGLGLARRRRKTQA